MTVELFGISLELPPWSGDATEAQTLALGNILEGRGVNRQYGVAALAKEAGFTLPLTKAEASVLIDWTKQADEPAYKALVHRCAESAGQAVMF